jgi:hypothetical protein
MGRQIENAKAAGPSAARANSAKTYPSVTSWASMQDTARPNLLNRDAEIGRAYDGVDENKTHDCL